MVCVAVKGDPIIGVIHGPFSGTTSWAVVGYSHSNDLKELVSAHFILFHSKHITC